jgi:hypothetical protein
MRMTSDCNVHIHFDPCVVSNSPYFDLGNSGYTSLHLTDVNGAFRMSAIVCSNLITLQQRGKMSIDVSDGTN